MVCVDLLEGRQRVVCQGEQVQLGLPAGVHLEFSHQVVQIHALQKSGIQIL